MNQLFYLLSVQIFCNQFAPIFGMAIAEERTMESKLYHQLMDDYEMYVRPTKHHTLLTNVTFGFLLHQVVDVAEKSQILTTRSWLNINWLDTRLTWNSSLNDDIEFMYINDKKIWKPDIFLLNNADPKFKDAWVSTEISVNKMGNISWFISAIFRSSCSIRVRFYPFDFQECNLTFASWSHHGGELDLRLISEAGDLSSYVTSTEFDLISMSAKREVMTFSNMPDKPWPIINIIIRLERRPLFYVFNHILPCVLISSMAMLGFYVPPDTGEKVTLCITTMLSMGVYLKTVTEQIPPTSEAVPLIGVYYVVSLFVVCAATVANVYTLNLFNYGRSVDAKPVPGWIKRWILGHLAYVLCIKVTVKKTESDEQSSENKVPAKKELKKFKKRTREESESQDCFTLMHYPNNFADLPYGMTTSLNDPSNRSHSTPQVLTQQKGVYRDPARPSLPFDNVMAALRPPETATDSLKSEFEKRFQTILNRICRTLELSDSRQASQDDRTKIVYEWRMLALVVDRCLLVLFLTATMLTTFLILFEPAFIEDDY